MSNTPLTGDVYVERAFADAERQAERTAGWLRLVVSLSLAVVLAPLILNPDFLPNAVVATRVQMAIVTIIAFLGSALATLFVTRPGRYRPWHAWAFVTGDMVLIGLNGYFALHGTTMGFGYVLATPPVWMVPILLAIGALRFKPSVAAYGTVLAVLVIGSMALQAGPGGREDLLESMFALPPNVIRLVMLALFGGILAYAAARNRALVRRQIDETWRAANLTRYLPPEIAGRLARDVDRVRRGERLMVAVMFVDLRGFTAFSESREPELLGRFLAAYRGRVAAVVKRHGGMVDKFVGDGVMAVFGASGAAAGMAGQALACTEALADDMARWDGDGLWPGAPPLPVAIGLHYGEAFCGAVGDDERLEFTVLGDTVNLAARLEQVAKSCGVVAVVSDQALRGAGNPARNWRELPPQEIRGYATPMKIWALAP
jgi:adenylate cyclase